MDAARILVVLTIAGISWQPAESLAQSANYPTQGTANFAGQTNSWSNSNSAGQPATSYDRYGQPAATPAPPITTRVQNGVVDTGNALRDGFDAGMRAAADRTASAFGGTSSNVNGNVGASAVSSPWPTTPVGSSGGTASGVIAVDGGWTSIGTGIAAPKLLIPHSPMANGYSGTNLGTTMASNYGNSTESSGRYGPNLSAPATNESLTEHSVLTDSSRPTSWPSTASTNPTSSTTNNPAADWTTTWNNNGGSSPSVTASGPEERSANSRHGRSSESGRNSGLVPIATANNTPTETNGSTGTRSGADTDPWTRPPQSTLGPPPGFTTAEKPAATNGNFAGTAPNSANGVNGSPWPNQTANNFGANGSNNGGLNNGGPSSGTGFTTNPGPNTVRSPFVPANGSVAGVNNPTGRNLLAGNTPGENQQWLPLVLAVLTLAGSLAANLFLGMSYLDARQKYQSLVRKTAETFRRVKAAAA